MILIHWSITWFLYFLECIRFYLSTADDLWIYLSNEYFLFISFDWFILLKELVDWLAAWLMDWWNIKILLIYLLTCILFCWSIDLWFISFDWFILLHECIWTWSWTPIDWLIGWLVGWFVDWLIDLFIVLIYLLECIWTSCWTVKDPGTSLQVCYFF